MNPSDSELDLLLKRLHLANARRIWRDLVQRAETQEWSYRDFMALLAAEEVAHRQQTRIARLTHRARFRFLKTIDDFDFTYPSTVRLALLGAALSPDFVTEGRSLILSGKPGRGKTHLAIAIAYRAIQNGFDALFVTAAEMIDDLSNAFREGRLAAVLPRYAHPAVLVVDEVGSLTYGTDAANVLFHVVNDRHRRCRSMVFTTNKSLDAWGKVLHDPDLAHAIVDRVLERGRLLRLDGPSLRTRHLGLDDPTQAEAASPVARISGKVGPEFPEPAASSCARRRASGPASARATRTASRTRRCGRGWASSRCACRRFARCPGGEPLGFYPKSLERGLRSERARKLAIAEMYVQGVSTRRVTEITRELCGLDVTSTDVSRAAAELDAQLTAWRERPLGRCSSLILDARYEKVRHGGAVIDCAVLVAMGVREEDGKRTLLGVSVSLSEAEVHWRAFLEGLCKRRLEVTKLITSDDHAGLRAARRAVLPNLPWQRCQFHLQQNAQAYVPQVSMRPQVGRSNCSAGAQSL